MTALKAWLLSIMAVSVLGTMLIVLTEKTAGHIAMKTAVSLALVLTVLSPLGDRIALPAYLPLETTDTAQYARRVQEQTLELTQQELSNYLEAYAARRAIVCDAAVSCALSQDGEISPVRVTVRCEGDESAAREALDAFITDAFGVSVEQIEYIGGT